MNKIFKLIKIQNGGLRGKKYVYKLQTIDGETLSMQEHNRDYVAAIVTKYTLPNRQGRPFAYTFLTMSGTVAGLGKALTKGARADAEGVALIETVRVRDRHVAGTHLGMNIVPVGVAHVDWSELPAEFKQRDGFSTLIDDPDAYRDKSAVPPDPASSAVTFQDQPYQHPATDGRDPSRY